jgi:hypothetical protein
MNSSIDKAKALRAQMLASVAPSKEGRKTLKGQRSSAAKVVKGKVAKAIKSIAASVKEDLSAVAGWTPPVSFNQWLKWHKTEVVDAVLKVNGTVSDWGRIGWNSVANLHADVLLAQASLRKEYQVYVNATFSQAISFFHEGASFEKIVRREQWLERQGKHDLGLLGYSAIDRVQIAVYYAWVKNVKRYLTQTGAEKSFVKELGQALSDLRSDDELRQLAELDGRSRYILSGTRADGMPRIRKQSQAEAVTIAARWLELRAEFDAMPVAEYAKAALTATYEKDTRSVSYEVSSFIPSVGDVYQQLFAVTREGMRQFRNTLEGLTQDGVISDATQYIAGHRNDLVSDGMDVMVARLDASLKLESVEDEVIERYELTETYIKQALIASLASKLPSSTVAEANAKTFLQLVTERMPLADLRETFSDLSETAFGRLASDAAIIRAEVQASNIFIVKFDAMIAEARKLKYTA